MWKNIVLILSILGIYGGVIFNYAQLDARADQMVPLSEFATERQKIVTLKEDAAKRDIALSDMSKKVDRILLAVVKIAAKDGIDL